MTYVLQSKNPKSLFSCFKKLTARSISAFAYTATISLGMLSNATHATTLKWAHVYEAASPYNQVLLMASEKIKKQTDGRVDIKIFPASSLGKELELSEALDFGTVDIIYTGEVFAGNTYAPLSISALPFAIRDYDHWKAYRDSDFFKENSARYESETGHKIAGLTYYGSRHVTSNIPISKPSDMKGLKIRVPNSPLYMMFPNSVGANPTPMAFSEVYLALQQGAVDAQENPLPTIKFKKFYEVQKYINLTGHMTNSLVSIVSKSVKDKVSADDYAILLKVAKESAEIASEEINVSENDLVSWFVEQGVNINKVDRKPFMAAVKPYATGKGSKITAAQLERLQAIK